MTPSEPRKNNRTGLENLSTGLTNLEVGNKQSDSAADQTFQQNILTTAKGGSISFFGRIFEYAVRFIFSIVVARMIGAEQYGLYVLGLTIVPIASMLSLLGLQTGVIAFLVPAIREKDNSRIWGIIQVCAGIPALLSILFGTALFLFAEPLATLAFHEPRLISLLQIVSISIPLDAIGFIAYQVAISYKKPKFSVIANNMVVPLAKLLLTIGFLKLGLGVFGIILAHVIGSAFGLALLLFFVNSLLPKDRPFTTAKRNPGELLRYSLPVHLGWVLNIIRGTLETLVLGFVGLTTGVGIFAVAQRLSTLGTMLFLSIGNISTPIIADFYTRGEMGQLKKLYQTTTKWVVMFNIPLFLTFVIFAKPILSIFGADFMTGATALIIMSIGNLVYTGTGLGANILDMTNHTKFNSANSAFMVVITIASDLLLIPRWGVIGAAAASAFSTVIVNVVCLIEVYVLLKIHPYGRDILKPVFAGSITAGAAYLLNQIMVLPPLLQLLVGSGILWGVYALILTRLGLSDDDTLILTNMRSRIKLIMSFGRSGAQ
jgi:O-antigen/teichoic acid export membrane protein